MSGLAYQSEPGDGGDATFPSSWLLGLSDLYRDWLAYGGGRGG